MNLTFQVVIPAGGVINLQVALFGTNPTALESNAYVQWLLVIRTIPRILADTEHRRK